jgi:hypothetical protein
MRSSDPTFNLLVPVLLKHWKRLQPGLELSAEAFINLSKHFKEQNKIWLAEDKVAQHKRHNNPGAMDIYDMSKSQGIGNIPHIFNITIRSYYMIIAFSSDTGCHTASSHFGGRRRRCHPRPDILAFMWT